MQGFSEQYLEDLLGKQLVFSLRAIKNSVRRRCTLLEFVWKMGDGNKGEMETHGSCFIFNVLLLEDC